MNYAEYKRDVHKRLCKARSNGKTWVELSRATKEELSIMQIMMIYNAELVKIDWWEALDKGLKRLGY